MSSPSVEATKAWVGHLVSCQQCSQVAREYGSQGERCTEGQGLRDALHKLTDEQVKRMEAARERRLKALTENVSIPGER